MFGILFIIGFGISFYIWYFFVRQTITVCNEGDKPCLKGRCIKNKCINQCDPSNSCKPNFKCFDNRCEVIKPPVPLGKYCGTVSHFGKTLNGEMNFSTNGMVDFSTSDAISVTCNAEPFTMDGSLIMITNIGTQDECIHDKLVSNNVNIENVTYSKDTNQITLKANVKISIFNVPVNMTLSSCV